MRPPAQSPFKRFLDANRVSQAEVARGIEKSTAYVSMLATGRAGASQRTVVDLLLFLSKRLRRVVTYEELFVLAGTKARKGVA
jgi:hypothetical protein